MTFEDATRGGRILVFAPHPDDEAIAIGGFLSRITELGDPFRIVFVTDGENNPWPHRALRHKWRLTERDRAEYAALRRAEALAALAVLGVPACAVQFLHLPDHGLARMLRRDSARFQEQFSQIVSSFEPTLIVGPSPDDLHPDHHAVARILDETRPRAAELVTYLVHGQQPAGSPRFEVRLTAAERGRKRRAILCHQTQMILSRDRFLQYAGDDERLHPFPPGQRGRIFARPVRRYWFVARSQLRIADISILPPPVRHWWFARR